MYPDLSESELYEKAVRTRHKFCQSMCRRSMIRKGYLSQWFVVLVQEFFGFFGVRYIHKLDNRNNK